MTIVPFTGDFRVPKVAIPAEITLLGQPLKAVKIFLDQRARSHAGPERPSDLLNAAAHFFPAIEPPGKVVFIQRESVVMVAVAAEHEFREETSRAEEIAAETVTTSPIEVVLRDGSAIRGSVAYLMPAGRSRLLDFLNTGDRFITLREVDTARFINKRHVARVSTL